MNDVGIGWRSQRMRLSRASNESKKSEDDMADGYLV
jgi:hypothetical protein